MKTMKFWAMLILYRIWFSIISINSKFIVTSKEIKRFGMSLEFTRSALKKTADSDGAMLSMEAYNNIGDSYVECPQ
jgi:hypothetical protein